MRNTLITALTITVSGLGLATPANAAPIKECYQGICSAIDTPTACVEAGQQTQIAVTGELSGVSGMAFTAYQVVADAQWRYNDNHQVELINGKALDSKGFHFGSTFANKYTVTGGEAQKYTFIYGSRVFGHGFYDVAVDLPMGEGSGSSTSLQLDIKPGSCPNPFNVGSKGVTPVAIVGTSELDVRSLDLDSIRLQGVAPVKYSYEDISSEIPNKSNVDCTTSTADGKEDLSLKFLSQQLSAAIETKLGRQPFDGEIVTLELTAAPAGSTESACGSGLTGEDSIQALVKGKK